MGREEERAIVIESTGYPHENQEFFFINKTIFIAALNLTTLPFSVIDCLLICCLGC